ncbi:hypothetical protein ACHAW6_004036 [Cyclotella cf. meneghiniana]
MLTMAASQKMHSSATAHNGNNNSPTAGSMPTSKTAWLREPSETLPREVENSSCMPWQDGHKWWIWHNGHTHYIMRCIFSTLLLFFLIGLHVWNHFWDPE